MKRKIWIMCVLCVCCAAMILAAAVPAGAADEAKPGKKYDSLLVLGDSISTGYGLPDYDAAKPENPYDCGSYANRLAKALHLEAGKTYINKAVNGDRTEDLLTLLPAIRQEIASSSLIVVSIGGNDMLRRLPELLSMLSGLEIKDLGQSAAVLSNPEFAGSMAAGVANPQVTQMLTGVVMSNAILLSQIVTTLKTTNPTADVVFLKQYNPMHGVPSMQGLNLIAEPLIGQINAAMDRVVPAAGYKVADIPAVIDSSAAARTNILSMDIHPNLAGHGMIFEKLCETLGIEPECDHVWSKWKEISEGPATEAWTGERTCEKCGATETGEFPARETKAPETTGSPENPKDPGKKEKKGCGSTLAAGAAVIALYGVAFVYKKK